MPPTIRRHMFARYTAGRIWRQVTLLWTLVAIMAMTLLLGGAPPAHADDSCPNAVQLTENHSNELPECRAYEMVTAPYKEGFAIVPRNFTDDGIVSYFSTGNFAGGGPGLSGQPVSRHALGSGLGHDIPQPTRRHLRHRRRHRIGRVI